MAGCFCCLLLNLGNSEDKSLLLKKQSSRANLFTDDGQIIEENYTESSKTLEVKNKVLAQSTKEIKVIWAINPETNVVFTKLGATDIVPRYDKLLNEWKCLKDAEKEFKQIMGLDQDKDIVHCIDCIPPDMRIGFSHGSNEYEFYLDIDPLALDKLNAPLTNQLKRALHLFTIISKQMAIIQVTGSVIVKDLEKLVKVFKQNEPFVDINGVQYSVELLNAQQVEQAYLIIKDIVGLSTSRSHQMMDYILQQGDKVDLQVIKDDPGNPKVIIFSKKLSICKKRKSVGTNN